MSALAALTGLAAQNLAAGRPADALRLLNQLMADHAHERSLLALRAQALYAMGEGQEAAGSMAGLVVLAPGEAEGMMALGLLLDSIKAGAAAEKAFERARSARPTFAQPCLALALTRIKAGRIAEAFDLIATAGIGTSSPDRIGLEGRLVEALREAQSPHFPDLVEAVRRPDLANAPIALQTAVDVAFHRMDFTAAEAALDRLTRLRPDWPTLGGQRAMARFNRGDWAAALTALPPGGGSDRFLFQGIAEARLGKRAEALASLTAAAEAADADGGDHWLARLLLARAARATGDAAPLATLGAAFGAALDRAPHLALMLLKRALGFDNPAYDRVDDMAGFHHAVASLVAAKGLQAFPCYPETYLVPDEAVDLAAADPQGVWILKPVDFFGGHGVSLTDEPQNLRVSRPTLVQKYVENPLLMNGRKGHLRLYLVLPAPELGRALVFDDGVVRFAAEPYSLDGDALDEAARHITNTVRFIGHPGIDTKAADGEPWATVWSLKAYLGEVGRTRGVKAQGQAWNHLTRLARDVARLIDHAGILAVERQNPAPWSFPPKVLAIDCLIDDQLNAHILEIERHPGIGMSAPADGAVSLRLARALSALAFEPEGPLPDGLVPLYAPPAPKAPA